MLYDRPPGETTHANKITPESYLSTYQYLVGDRVNKTDGRRGCRESIRIRFSDPVPPALIGIRKDNIGGRTTIEVLSPAHTRPGK